MKKRSTMQLEIKGERVLFYETPILLMLVAIQNIYTKAKFVFFLYLHCLLSFLFILLIAGIL